MAKSGSQGRYAIMHVAERKLNYARRIKKKKIIGGPCNALHKESKFFQREYFPFFNTETKFQMALKFKWPIRLVNVHLVNLIE